jgi:predicted hydrocarbon binding protein
VKGTALRGVLHYLKVTGGDIPDVLALLPQESRSAFDSPILVTSWYPYDAYVALLEAVTQRRAGGSLDLLPEIGRWLAMQDTGMFFKLVVSLASIETMARRCPEFWMHHCDTGTLECTSIDVKRRTGTAVIRGVPGIHPAHCGLVGGWIEGMAEGAGARGMKVRQVECAALGHSECRFEGAWGR